MRQSHAAVLERHTVLTGEFATEPYEVGWAVEARWFVRFVDPGTHSATLRVRTQVSPDGLNWCDEEEPRTFATADGLVSWPVREFGQWLRIAGTVEGEAKALVYLTLKS